MRLFRLIAALLVIITTLAAVVVVRAVRLTSRQVAAGRAARNIDILPGAVDRLAAAIRFQTITPDDPADRRDAPFAALEGYLVEAFPRTHAALTRETIGRDSLLYTWRGTDAALKPIVLMGHLDVVPVESATEKEWRHPPFTGEVIDGVLWGRGALDDKPGVLGILEAVESLVARGFNPRRTILLAFGTDEESGGQRGARLIADAVRARYGTLDFVLDEGGAILPPATVPGISVPLAVVGIAEKGFVTVQLAVDGEGGHSSTPPRHTAAGILAKAITHLEDHPFPAALRGASAELFDTLAPEMPFRLRVLFGNRWLFDPAIVRVLARSPATDAAIRTTTAVTMLQGSPKDNVLPSRARAVVNFRIMPGESIETVLAHVREVVDDPAVQVDPVGVSTLPSRQTSTDAPNWQLVARSLRQTFPDTLVAPYLVLGGTDARYFAPLTADIYRLLPVKLPSEGTQVIHGVNERVSTSSYLDAIRFYSGLIQATE